MNSRQSKKSCTLSQISQTSKKSVKSINASLERIHTFGMSVTHKSIHDLEKAGESYDAQKKDKKIVKTTSLAKLKPNENVPKKAQGPHVA